jgi:hypothetical protein
MTQNSIPAALRVASILVFVESAATFALGVYFLWSIPTGKAILLQTMIALTVFVVVTAAWLGWLAAGLLKAKRSARTPVVFWQLILLLLAGGQVSGKFANYAIGAALVIPAIAIIVLLSSKNVAPLFRREL